MTAPQEEREARIQGWTEEGEHDKQLPPSGWLVHRPPEAEEPRRATFDFAASVQARYGQDLEVGMIGPS